MFFLNTNDNKDYIYRQDLLVRSLAYQTLLKYNIDSLPISFNGLSDTFRITTMQLLSKFTHESLESLFEENGNYGFVGYSKRDNMYGIFYNGDLPDDMKNWTIACLLAAIELGYVRTNDAFCMDPDSDELINNFSYYFLAPDPILMECEIFSTSDIMCKCQIPFKYAYRKSRKLKKKTNTYSSLEWRLKNYFKRFINEKPSLRQQERL